MTKPRITSSQLRSEHGQGIILGVLVVMLLTAIICGGAVFLVSVGTAMYYQQRFDNVARGAARFAVNCDYWLGAERPTLDIGVTNSKTVAVTQAMLSKMGVSPSQATITVDQSRPDGCVVTIAIQGLPAIQGLVPGTMSITASGFQSWMAQAPIATEAFIYAQNQHSYFLPSYGAGAYTPGPSGPPDAFFLEPYWETGGFNGLVPPLSGPYQNYVTGGPCANCY
jgi:hypothetical protein